METVMATAPWTRDNGCLPIPWTAYENSQSLRIGILAECEKRPLHPVMCRTMSLAADKMKQKGHRMVPIGADQIPSLYDVAVLGWTFFLIDPQKTPVKFVTASGEPWVKSISATMVPELQEFEASLDKLWDMILERNKMVATFKALMKDLELDAILMPPYQSTAVPHDTYGFPLYTTIANVLDWPAGSMPFCKASQEDDRPFYREDVQYMPPCK